MRQAVKICLQFRLAVTDWPPAARAWRKNTTMTLCEPVAAIAPFDYGAAAELFPVRVRLPNRQSFVYRRFERADEAIRYAIEELPRKLLMGAYLEVDEVRFDCHAIRRLYESDRYPFPHRAAAQLP